MIRISRGIVAMLAATLIATAAYGQDEHRFEQQFNRTVPYPGGTITIDHKFGGLNIRTASASEVNVRAFIRASDPEFGKAVRINVTTDRNGIRIMTHYPEGRSQRNRDSSWSVDYQITVPANAPLRVSNRFGSVNATGIASGSEIINGHGSIRLVDSRGKQTVENSFGSIDVRSINGNVVLKNANGSIRGDEIHGMADVTNRFGSVHFTKTSGSTVIRNANGSIVAREIQGPLTVENAFGSIQIDGIGGNVDVEASNSRVRVRAVGGNANVRSTFGAIDVDDVKGSARVENQNGSVKISDVKRATAVKTTFASVTVKDVSGPIDVENQNGAIAVSGVPACQGISLKTSFSTIKLELPSDASYTVNARTSFGRISSDLPITTRSLGEETTVGTIGSGKCRLELVNMNGNINIDKE